jgi:putative MATE family efflux protein
LGQGKYDTAQHILGNTISLNLLLGTLFAVVCIYFLDDILILFGASSATLPYAREYMFIILLGNVITHLYFGLNAILRSAGHPTIAMNCTFLTIIINTLLDPLFIFVFHWGIAGVAWATVISQAVSLCVQLKLFSRPTELLHLRRGIYKPDFNIIRQCIVIGLSPFLMNSCACIVILFINNRLRDYGGDMAIGAHGVVNRIIMLFVTTVIGLVQGMQPIAGYNWGAHKNDRVWRVLRYTIGVATCITCFATLICELIPEHIISIFGTGEELTGIATHACRIIVAMFPLVGAQIVIGNFFQSIGHAGKSIFLSMTRQMLMLIPLLYFLPSIWGQEGIWYSMPISDSISFFLAAGMLMYMVRKAKRHEANRTA